MNRHQHPSNNTVLGAPPGVPIEECNALPITRAQYADDHADHIAFAREIEAWHDLIRYRAGTTGGK